MLVQRSLKNEIIAVIQYQFPGAIGSDINSCLLIALFEFNGYFTIRARRGKVER